MLLSVHLETFRVLNGLVQTVQKVFFMGASAVLKMRSVRTAGQLCSILTNALDHQLDALHFSKVFPEFGVVQMMPLPSSNLAEVGRCWMQANLMLCYRLQVRV